MKWEEGKKNIFHVETGTGCNVNIAVSEVIFAVFLVKWFNSFARRLWVTME